MGLFDTKRRQLDDMEREVLGNPTPQNLVSLVERYMAVGDEAKALDVARKAVDKFPDSEKVQTTFQNVRKIQLQAEIQRLNKDLRTNPSKGQYERLSDLYHRELGNRNKAFEIALEGLGKFPNSDGLHMVSGLIRMDRFHQDHLANDFTEAMRHFQKASTINPNHYKALASMARLYCEVCVYDKAIPVLDQVLRANPGDDHAAALRALVEANRDSASKDVDDALMEIESNRTLSPLGLEAAKIFDPNTQAGAVPQVNHQKIGAFLETFQSMSGYKCSAVLSPAGERIAAHSRGVVPVEQFIQFIKGAYQCSEEGARKMDIGSFVSGELETSIGRVAIAEWKSFIIGILADQPAKKEDLDRAVERFVSFLSVG